MAVTAASLPLRTQTISPYFVPYCWKTPGNMEPFACSQPSAPRRKALTAVRWPVSITTGICKGDHGLTVRSRKSIASQHLFPLSLLLACPVSFQPPLTAILVLN